MNWWDKANDVLSKISPSDKIHMTNSESIDFQDMTGQQSVNMKPVGLWYACGTDWLDWVQREMPDWKQAHLFKIKINPSSMIMVSDGFGIDKISKNYGVKKHEFLDDNTFVDWTKVAQKYSGIEICPYQWSKRMNTMWYYPWDVASGCIWGSSAFLGAERLT